LFQNIQSNPMSLKLQTPRTTRNQTPIWCHTTSRMPRWQLHPENATTPPTATQPRHLRNFCWPSLEYPTMPPAGSSKVLRAPARWVGIRRAPKTKIYNLETGE
jgi:hypothetical protein